jgi:hypothetical protein
VHSAEEFETAISSAADNDVLLLVKQGEYSRYILLPHED